MVASDYPQGSGRPIRKSPESILFVHPEKNEQLWDIYVWRFPQYNGTAEPSLVSLASKRHQDKSLDLKLIALFLPSRQVESQSIERIPYHEYVRRKANFVLELGTKNLEKRYMEGERQ